LAARACSAAISSLVNAARSGSPATTSADTLFSLIEGIVKFEDKGRKGKFISVYALGAPQLAPKVTAEAAA